MLLGLELDLSLPVSALHTDAGATSVEGYLTKHVSRVFSHESFFI